MNFLSKNFLKVSLFLFSLTLLNSCNEKSAPTTETSAVTQTDTVKAAPVAGADKDSHGCIPSAGYVWSELKKECVRAFEQTIQLESKDKTLGAGVIFSEDKKAVEVFSAVGNMVLAQKTADLYEFKKADTSKTVFVFYKNKGHWMFGNNLEKDMYTEKTSK